MTLDGIEIGVTAHVVAVDWSALAPDEAKRLQALGIDEGAEIRVVHRGVFAGRDPLAVEIGAMTVALRRSHARVIAVALQSPRQ